mmetsp:Transcript_30404/g.63345  ORF Transcript_30404/g.63345 Transcript_30404/m.63345 type:complete len:268 (+) Transcript_30404:89-892(+)
MMMILTYPKATLIAFLATRAISTDAAYRMYSLQPITPMHRSFSAGIFPSMNRQAFFPREFGRIMHDFIEMFDNVLGSFDETFYEPLEMSRLIPRPSYLLEAKPESNALALIEKKKAMEITQNDKDLQIVLSIPGAKASDINLQLDQDNRVLKVFGEIHREEEGISVKSSFYKTFVLSRNIDASKISARMENGVLAISVPKTLDDEKKIRRIDIVEEKVEQEEHDMTIAEMSNENKETEVETNQKMIEIPEVQVVKDDSVIDLDIQQA